MLDELEKEFYRRRRGRRKERIIALGCLLAVVGLGVGAWWWFFR